MSIAIRAAVTVTTWAVALTWISAIILLRRAAQRQSSSSPKTYGASKGELTDIAAAVADSPVGHRKADSMTLLRGDRGSEEDIQQGRSSWIKVGFVLKEVVMRERR